MVSSDIVSLHTKVPLQDSLQINIDAPYKDHLDPALFPESSSLKFMRSATEVMEFSFNNTVSRWSFNGQSPGSDISQHFYERLLFEKNIVSPTCTYVKLMTPFLY